MESSGMFDLMICCSLMKYIIIIGQLTFSKNMFHKATSFTSFKKIINNTTIATIHHQTLNPLQPELMIESNIQQSSLELGLQSQKSKLQNQGVRSSIDSFHRKKQSSGSIPLSQLILRDNGYDYLFNTKDQLQKMRQKQTKNLKQMQQQTQQMITLVSYQLLVIEQAQIKQKVYQLQRQILKIKTSRKSKSPIQQQSSQYLCSMGRKRKQRLSGRLLQIHKENRSNMKTQCDSKASSLPSAPVTPINQHKLMPSPNKNYKNEFIAILKAKKNLLKQSINTIKTYNSERIMQIKQQSNILRQELLFANSQIHLTPITTNNLTFRQRSLDTFRTSPCSKNSSYRRLMGMRSPQSIRQSKKNQMIKLISDMKNQTRCNPREEYFLLSR